MIHQPVDDVDVVVAVVGDIGHRTLADIEIPRQAGLSGTVNATQPEIVIAARVRVSARQPFLLLAEIGRRGIAGNFRVKNSSNHRTQQRRLRTGEEVRAVGVEHRSVILNLVKEVLHHAVEPDPPGRRAAGLR